MTNYPSGRRKAVEIIAEHAKLQQKMRAPVSSDEECGLSLMKFW